MTRLVLALTLLCSGCSLLGDGSEGGCADAWPTFSGQLRTDVGNILFETITTANVSHHDAGAEAGCVTDVLFELGSHDDFDCSLTVTAGGDLDDEGRLPVTSIALRGTGACDSFPAELRGTYYEENITGSGLVFGGGVTNPEDTVEACYESTFELELAGTLVKSLGDGVDVIDLAGTSIVIQGPMPSTGVTAACPR